MHTTTRQRFVFVFVYSRSGNALCEPRAEDNHVVRVRVEHCEDMVLSRVFFRVGRARHPLWAGSRWKNDDEI